MLKRLFALTRPTEEQKFNIQHPAVRHDLAVGVKGLMAEAAASGRDIVILCIGTDRSTGDALGPLTGSKLRSLRQYPHIFGTLADPVHATNLPDTLRFIGGLFANPYLIAVDACLGKLENVGCVTLGPGPLRPGAAVNKDLPPVGDACITGIVNVGGFMEHLVLQSTRLSLVFDMAEIIAYGLAYGLSEIAAARPAGMD